MRICIPLSTEGRFDMEEVLLFGGAFNPVTIAHIEDADFARKTLGLTHVIFMPSKSHYILNEEKKDFSFSEEARLKMLKESSSSRPWMLVDDYELSQKEQSRTYFTLKHLKEEGFQARLLFGSDWIKNLKAKWKYIDEIGKEFSFVVMKRNGDDLDRIFDSDSYLKERRKYFTFLDTPKEYQDISSSKVRLLLKEGKMEEARKYLPGEVYLYLKKKGDSL